MRIGLIDVDGGSWPNLVLMKLSAWYKKQGDEVELLKPGDVLKGENLFFQYDRLYAACVFTWNSHIADMLDARGVYVAGTGTKSKNELKPEVEHIMPDYSLYGSGGGRYRLRIFNTRMPTALSFLHSWRQRGVD